MNNQTGPSFSYSRICYSQYSLCAAHPRSRIHAANYLRTRRRFVKWATLIRKCLTKDLLSNRDLNARVVRLDIDGGNLSVLDHKGVTLRPVTAEDGLVLEVHVNGLGELTGRVGKETELHVVSSFHMYHDCL